MKRPLPLLCILLAALFVACSTDETPPPLTPTPDPLTRVVLSSGTADGFVDERGVHVWLGLRYAQPPVGPLRWRAPLAPHTEAGARDATSFGDVCPQIGSPLGGAPQAEYAQLWGEEDCLFLNVYAPAHPRTKLPVLVWVHGGGNTVGHSGFYDGAPLAAAHNVIVVTLNYRLGPFGWLHHAALAGDSDADASGNYGTLDLIQALKWIQKDISVFGGDPAMVTVFGQSAGARNIVSLLVSPAAQGLFHGAILQSGSTRSVSVAEASHLTTDAQPGLDSSSGELLLRALQLNAPNCDRACALSRVGSLSLKEQEATFRALSVRDVFRLFEGHSQLLGPNSPTVIRDGTLLPDRPFMEVLEAPGTFNQVPVLLGTNRDEPKIFQIFDPAQVTRFANIPLWSKDTRHYALHAEYGALAWRVRGVDDIAQRLHKAAVPLWSYRWDWDEEGHFLFANISQLLGAAHGLEVPFVFGHFDLGPQTSLIFNSANAAGRHALSARMMAYWAAFARDLDPGTGADGSGPLWEAFDPAAGKSFLRLDTGADGIQMMPDLITFDTFVDRLATDERFTGSEERCAVFATSVGLDGSPEQLNASRRLGCRPEAG